MSVSAYSTTPSSNATISGTNIAENCPAGNVNDAIRQLMADIRAELTDAVLSITAKATVADIRTALGALQSTAAVSSIGGLTPAADKFPYYTGASAAALADLSAFIRTLLDDPDGATARGTLGAIGVSSYSLAANGYFVLTLNATDAITINWGTFTTGANGWSANYNFPRAFTSSCFGGVATYSTINAGAADGTSVGFRATSKTQFQLGSEDNAQSAFMIAMGV